jgi:methionyl-tRNA formyltransferase
VRTVFFGTPELAVPSLAALHERHDVTAVVCQPDRPSGRGNKPTAPPIKRWAQAHGIPVLQPEKLNDGPFEAWLREQGPEVCTLAAYGRILKRPILDVPPHGFLNMHPSLLPLYRGPSPIQSAILNGDEETGITIIRISMDMDAGDVLLQERMPIHPEDNGETLTRRLADRGGVLLAQAVDMVERGDAVFTPQDHARATYCRLFEKRDGLLNWSLPATALHNLVRAARPWPCAQCRFEGEMYKILRTEPTHEGGESVAGTILRVERDRIVVATGEGALAILEIQPPGKRPMTATDFLRGHPVRPGQRFESVQ